MMETTMLTNSQVERLGRLVRLMPYMDQAMQAKLLELVRDLKAAEGAGAMPTSVTADLAQAVPDKLCAEIVNDLRSAGRTEPGGWIDPGKVEPREPVKARAIPLEPPSGIRYVDEIAEAFADLDKRELEKRLKGGR
jgi:hypothetical protein